MAEQRRLDSDLYWIWHLTSDEKPLSDTEADDRLKAALEALGTAPGETVHANTALKAARKALMLLSLGLIGAGLKEDQERDPSTPVGPR